MNQQITTNEKTVTITKEAIIIEVKRLEENCLHTSKGHFVAAQFWSNFHLWLGIPTVVLAAIAGTAALSKLDNSGIVVGVLSIIIVVLTAISTFLNPKEKASNHLNSGNDYDSLLTRARIFWSIECKREDSDQILTKRLNNLTELRNKFNKECPQVPRWAYNKAKQGIESGEANYKIDRIEKVTIDSVK